MTYEEYFEGLGCSPEEVEVCVAAAKARYARELDQVSETIERGFILMEEAPCV
jgi:predicted ATP-grasp superfamily ATP-dependent carboligase